MHSDFVEGTLVGVVSPVKAERRPEPETWSALGSQDKEVSGPHGVRRLAPVFAAE